MSAPQLNQVPFRYEDGDVTFLPGMNSSFDPAQLPPGAYARSMNTVNRGGVVQCRPGYRCKFAAPVGNLQGGSFFYPKQGSPVIVFGIEGLLYVSEFPYVDFRQIPGVEFVSFARQLFFKQVEQSIKINPDGSLSFITPRNLLVIQDGGQTSPAVYDGTTATHQKGAGTIPLGGPMEWVGDRLWVARGPNVYASDLANPLGFTESQYITTVDAFIFPGDVTAMSRTPSVEFPQLLVFTSSTTSLIQASIRDRSLWLTTPDFQKILFPNIGCTSQRSVVAHYGLLWWWSLYGLTSFDSAVLSKQTSSLPHRDNEMADSKGRLSEDTAGIACAAVENYLLTSVPYCDLYNTHTWVMDNSAYQTIDKMAPPVWNSFWTGTRPVCWLTGEVNDTSAVFYFSRDFDGNNRLWEAFTPDRLDDGCPITWYLETRGYYVKDPLGPKQFRFADIFLGELLGTVDIAVFWAGTARGKYKRILTKRIQATRGPFRASDVITADEILFGLKKQSRVIRTQDAKTLAAQETQTSCGVESTNAEFIDESFQLLIVVSGPGAVRSVQTFNDPQEGEKLSGKCEEDETEFREVRFDGAAEKNADFEAALAKLEADDIIFHATKTATLTSQGLSETAIGESQSTISQQTADFVAQTIARRKASHELEQVLPAIVSKGIS
jgi:hypothetical protein